MPTLLAPVAIQQFKDNNGNPLAGGQLYTYAAGTSTPQPSYTDATGTSANTNPVILNSRGEAPLWLTPGQFYKLVLMDASGVLIWSADQVPGGFVDAALLPDTASSTKVRADLIAGTGSNLSGFQAAGAGALIRTVQGKLRDIVSAKDFITMDGVTDDTVKLQALHDLFGPNGGAIFFPPGVTVISSVNITKQCMLIGSGASSGGTYVLAKDATSNVFNLQNSSIYIKDLLFNASVPRTDGAYILCNTSSSLVTVENCYMTGWFYGVRVLSAGGPFYFRNITMKNGVPVNGQAVRIDNGTDVTCDFLVVDNAVGSLPYGGVVIAASSDVSLINCQLQHCKFGLSVEPSANQIATSIYAVNCFFDNAGVHGVRLSPLSNTACAITRVRLLGCWASSAGGSGVFIDNSAFPSGGVGGIEITSLEAYLNTNGISINIVGTGNGNVDILGGKFSANSNSGINVFAVPNGLKIVGSKIGPNGALGGNANYGIQIASTVINSLLISSCDLTGNTVGAYSNASTGTNRRVCDNLGYNGATGPASITVGASPFTYTAGDTAETIYVNGGTVGLVTVEGINAFQQSNCTLKLNPGRSLIVSYTATPSMVKVLE